MKTFDSIVTRNQVQSDVARSRSGFMNTPRRFSSNGDLREFTLSAIYFEYSFSSVTDQQKEGFQWERSFDWHITKRKNIFTRLG